MTAPPMRGNFVPRNQEGRAMSKQSRSPFPLVFSHVIVKIPTFYLVEVMQETSYILLNPTENVKVQP